MSGSSGLRKHDHASTGQGGALQGPLTTTGDLIIGATGGAPTRLAAGATSGHVLTSNGAGAVPSYQAASGGGSAFVGSRIWRDTNQAIASGTETEISWTFEEEDPDGFFTAAVDATLITVPAGKAGRYVVSVSLPWASNATGYRKVRIKIRRAAPLNDLEMFDIRPAVNGLETIATFATDAIYFAAGDYCYVSVTQNSGASLNVTYTGTIIPTFAIRKV